MSFTFKKTDRIRKRPEYLGISKSGLKIQDAYFIIYYSHGRFNRSRLGITVTRKVGRATKRNNIKRLVREFFRLNRQNFSGEWDLNVVAKKKAAGISSQKAFDSLYALFSEISKNDGS